MPKLKFFGEGTDDVGKHESENEPNSLQALVNNILKHIPINEPHFEWKSNHIKRLKVHGIHGGSVLSKRVVRAMEHALDNEFDGAVFVIDQDGDKKLIKEIEKGRESFQEKGILYPLAVGVAIDELEAWLLADHKARRKNLGKKGGDDLGDIEKINDPKIKFDELYDHHFRDKNEEEVPTKSELKIKLASESNVETIARACPKGFRPFIGEVKKHLVPIFND